MLNTTQAKMTTKQLKATLNQYTTSNSTFYLNKTGEQSVVLKQKKKFKSREHNSKNTKLKRATRKACQQQAFVQDQAILDPHH